MGLRSLAFGAQELRYKKYPSKDYVRNKPYMGINPFTLRPLLSEYKDTQTEVLFLNKRFLKCFKLGISCNLLIQFCRLISTENNKIYIH